MPQPVEIKARALRLLSGKSASEILPEVRESMVQALLERPDAESITRRFGSTTIQVIFSILWVLAVDVRRLKVRCAATRDGFGAPRLQEVEAERRQPGREEGIGLRVAREVA